MLGKKVRDKVTGFEGTVTARCEYVSGSPQVCLASIDKDGNPQTTWLDEGRVEVLA